MAVNIRCSLYRAPTESRIGGQIGKPEKPVGRLKQLRAFYAYRDAARTTIVEPAPSAGSTVQLELAEHNYYFRARS